MTQRRRWNILLHIYNSRRTTLDLRHRDIGKEEGYKLLFKRSGTKTQQRWYYPNITGLNCHSHPFERGAVRFSPKDDTDDSRELAWQASELPRGKRSLGQKGEVYVASTVFGQKTLDARGYRAGLPPTLSAIEQVQVLGETLRILTPTGCKTTPSLSAQARATYDRQIMAFGEEGPAGAIRPARCHS